MTLNLEQMKSYKKDISKHTKMLNINQEIIYKFNLITKISINAKFYI